MHLPNRYSDLKFVGHRKSLPSVGAVAGTGAEFSAADGVSTAAELVERGPTSLHMFAGTQRAGALATKLFTLERGCGLGLRA